MKLEKISEKDPTEPPDGVLFDRNDVDVALDILNELNSAPEDTNWKFTVCRINTDANGVAIHGATEPQLLEGDASIMEGLPGRLRDEFGTGRYRIRVLQNKRLWKRFDIAVERAVKPANPAQPQSEMATVLAAMGKQNEQIISLLSRPQTFAPMAAPVTDPVAMFKVMFDMFKEFKPQPVAQQVVAPILAPEKAIELILQGVKLREEVGGDTREKGMMDIISDLLNSPIVTEIAKNMSGTQPPLKLPPLRRRAAGTPAPAQVNSKVTPPIPPAPQEQPANSQVAEFRKIILYLLARAQSGSSFETYAEWAFDSLPPPMIDSFLAQPQLVDIMQGIVPEIAPHREWFVKVVDELRLLVNDANAAQAPMTDVPGHSPSAFYSHVNAGGESGGTGDAEDDERID